MHAAILSIGDEITVGQQLDTNSMWLSGELVALGCVPVEHRTVADDRAAIASALRELGRRASPPIDAIVATGGLGPTLDDLTREALGDAIAPGEALVEDERARAHLARWLAGRGRSMPASNWRQALRPPTARMLDNPNGTAPGLAGELPRADASSCAIFCLPGPPREMQPMFRDHVAPVLRERAKGAVVLTATVMQVGLGESPAAELLGPLMERGRSPSVGTTASGGIVSARVRVEASADDASRAAGKLSETVEAICDAWRPYVFAVHPAGLAGRDLGLGVHRSEVASGTVALAASLGSLLVARRAMLAIAESCTGGLLGATIVDLAGSSDFLAGGFVTYSNHLKTSLLGVPAESIAAHGAVSEAVARAMALGALARTGAACALSITGVAGPGGGTDAKPVGTVFIASAVRSIDRATDESGGAAGAGDGPPDVRVRRFRFTGDRRDVRERAVVMAMQMLRLQLIDRGEATLLWEVQEGLRRA
ncbi:MAG: nicotinamide-nucleotide amidohydrolase family protein [Phycisphaerales bacterium]